MKIQCLVLQFQLMDAKSNEQRQQQLVHAWLHLLTCPKPTKWNEDKFVLFLIGTISKCAFVYDAQRMFGCVEIVLNLYKVTSLNSLAKHMTF
jgi:hypothetical protein